MSALPGKEKYIHAHNNMQMVILNALRLLWEGCTMLDATLMGLGRYAGNCPIKILIVFLKNLEYRRLPLL